MRLDTTRIAAEAHVLVPSRAKHAVGLLEAVEHALVEAHVPELRWREAILRTWHLLPQPGMRCIAIRHRQLREWTICIGASPEGAYLAVAWYLIAHPSWRGDLRRLLLLRSSARERETVGSELNAQRRAQLGFLSTLSRQALKRAIGEVAGAANSGPARSDTQRPRRRDR